MGVKPIFFINLKTLGGLIMITIKQFCIQNLINEEHIANRLGRFIKDNELLALINGIIIEVENIDFGKFCNKIEQRRNKQMSNLEMKSFEIVEGVSIEVYIEYNVPVYYTADESDWNWSENEKYNKPGTKKQREHITIDYPEIEEYGFVCKYE